MLAIGALCAAPASADTTVRDTSAGDLTVTSATPSSGQLERQAAAFWNPGISLDQKVAVSRGGAKARPALAKVMEFSKVYDFLSAKARVNGVSVKGDTATATMSAVVVGFPANTATYHYVREGGLWKFDWKANCQSMSCTGNPNFGY